MKVSYNIEDKRIITWWDEESNTGMEDVVYPGQEQEKAIYNIPNINHPDELQHPITAYCFNADGELEAVKERIEDKPPQGYSVDSFHHNIEFALLSVDGAAEDVRNSFITAKAGQILTYNIKESEARKFIAENRPDDATDYPMLAAESKGRNIDINSLADIIISKANEWIVIAANIETIRLQYKDLLKALDNSTEVDDIRVITEEAVRTLKEI